MEFDVELAEEFNVKKFYATFAIKFFLMTDVLFNESMTYEFVKMFAMVVAFYEILFAVALFWEVMKAFYAILFVAFLLFKVFGEFICDVSLAFFYIYNVLVAFF